MLRHLGTLLLVLGWLCLEPAHAADLNEFTGKGATPVLELEDLDGRRHTLADYRGRVVLVNFWASWCSPCLQEIPGLISLAERLKERRFTILAVNVGESKNKLPGFTRKMAEHMVMLLDPESEAFKRWEGIGLPSTFVLDGSGRIRYEAFGPVHWGAGYIVDMLTALMDKPAVEAAVEPKSK
jgi:thiol-disulfide isomerase/thioredoxin